VSAAYKAGPGASPTDQQIREALQRILDSKGFRSSRRLGQFLQFVAEKRLAGNEDEIKEYAIAVEVYGKSADYDPRVDSSVRVEAARLRTRLRQYYEEEGSADPVRIQLPKGRYIPVFEPASSGAETSPSAVPATENAAPPQQPPRPPWGKLALACAAIAAAVGFWTLRSPTANGPEIYEMTPITSDPGNEYSPSISPDGRQVAFSRSLSDETVSDIYVKQLGSEATLRITEHPALETSPAWSPDGTSIAFLRRLGPRRSDLVLIPSLGGPERVLAEVQAPPASGLTWSPDGASIVVIERLGEGSDLRSAFRVVPLEASGAVDVQVSLADFSKANYPALSPDGKRIAFLGTSGPWQGALHVASVDGGPIQRLADLEGQGAGIAWTRDGRGLIVGRFTPLRIRSMLRVDASDGHVSEITLGDNPSQPSISADGSRLVFAEQYLRYDIVRYSARESDAAPGTRFVQSTRFDGNPQYSPDGTRIAFSSARAGNIDVWVCDADGANPMQVTSIGGAGSPRWSPDGSRIAFDSTAGGSPDIYIVGAGGDVPRRVTNSEHEDVVPAWSPDGRWIYFSSDRGGNSQIWRISATEEDSSPAVAVTKDGGFYPAVSPDGDFLYFARERAKESSLWRMRLPDGQPEELMSLHAGWGNWQPAKTGVYFVDRDGDVSPGDAPTWVLRHLDPTSGKIATVRELLIPPDPSEPTLGGPGLSVSPGGQSLLLGQTTLSSDLALVEGFR